MRPFKFRIEKDEGGIWYDLPRPAFATNLRIVAIFYGGRHLNERLRFQDGDDDEFFSVPGQDEPRPAFLEHPITVPFPISMLDEDEGGQNKVVLWGEIPNPLDNGS